MDIAAFTADSIALFQLPPVAGRLFGVARSNVSSRRYESRRPPKHCSAEHSRPIRYGTQQDIPSKSSACSPCGKEGPNGRSPSDDLLLQSGSGRAAIGPNRFGTLSRARPMSKLESGRARLERCVGGLFRRYGVAADGRPGFSRRSMLRGCRVAVINQEAADLYFDGKAVGSAVIDDIGRRTEIIGVVHFSTAWNFCAGVRSPPSIFRWCRIISRA